MTIRKIIADEVPRLLPCIVSLAEYHNEVSVNFSGSFPSRKYEETVAAFVESLVNGSSQIFAAEESREIVGFCKIDINAPHGKLDYLSVLPDHRGKGIGGALMDKAMSQFRQSGVTRIEVKVIDGNPALRLYEKYGFRIQSHIMWNVMGGE